MSDYRTKTGGPDRDADYGWVITWGCRRTDKLHRLYVQADPGPNPAPVQLRKAPCCGQDHAFVAQPYRRRRSADEPYDAEVATLDELRPASPSPSPRRKVSDEAIVAALDASRGKRATEIAADLGYASGAAALVDRVKRMNARAEAAGRVPLISIERAAQPGSPTTLRLVCKQGDTVTISGNPTAKAQQ